VIDAERADSSRDNSMVFSSDDLEELTDVVTKTWRTGSDRDWSVPAGTLEWSCATTADHAIDTVLAPALFLASRKQDGYPQFEPVTLGPRPEPAPLVEGLETATRILTAVVRAADPQSRATIWRRPQLELRGPADFVPRAALELILHAHDVASGLNVGFDPPTALCESLRRHTYSWPMWTSPGWTQLTLSGDPWTDLLRASGRRPRSF
jgi:hypothetical protein